MIPIQIIGNIDRGIIRSATRRKS